MSLSQLKKRTPEGRKEAKGPEALRQTPRPSHPGRVKYEPDTNTPSPGEEAQVIDLRDSEAPLEDAPRAAVPRKPSGGAKRASKAPAAPETASEPPLTVYVDHVHNDFAKDVSHAGARRRPRVSISGAAVIRYALDQLRAEMTPEQACEAIAAKAAGSKTEGATDAQGKKRSRISAYVDSTHRSYVDEVLFARRDRRARGVNGSTVFRFAMDRLQGAMTAQEVCEAIAAKPVDNTKATGRKRR
jgi:hypothetical protein